MSETPERRQARRIAIRLPVVYRSADGTPQHGMTRNVSRRGMLIVAQTQPEGTRLRVAVTGNDGREREFVGEVVRSTGQGEVAVSIPEKDAAALEAIIDGEDKT